ncbi:hypothetical protein ENUP19_0011G0018 [Entamoeba nuttalli]|uniref:Uncharacterized protein n=1 Tax=Entamoeba nuttalli TaxID=412467 RepID=A0ABQ0D8C0_9EUKA
MSVATNSVYDCLSDKFKLLFNVLTKEQCEQMTNDIRILAQNCSFDVLFFNYEHFHFNKGGEYNIVELLRHEYTYILSILFKVFCAGVKSISQEVIDSLLLYIDDWCLRDGIWDAWSIAEELHEMALEREELEEEEEEPAFHWECEDSSLSELDLNKP